MGSYALTRLQWCCSILPSCSLESFPVVYCEDRVSYPLCRLESAETTEVFKLWTVRHPHKPFETFQWGIPQLYAKDDDALFLFEISEGGVNHDTQCTSIANWMDCLYHTSEAVQTPVAEICSWWCILTSVLSCHTMHMCPHLYPARENEMSHWKRIIWI
jgi:hypothetical protein